LRDCSLVVPASDGDDVTRLLDSLLAIPDAPGEVVIVDAGPSHTLGDSLRDWIGRRILPFHLVYAACPPGLTRLRNIGVDISTRDFIYFLDPAMEPLPGYFAITRRVFDLDRDRCVGGVTGVVVNRAGRGGGDPLVYSRSGAFRRDLPPFSGLRRVDVLPGSCAAWRREVFASRRFSCFFGSWPEGEDVEMSLRVGRHWTLLACGEARVKCLSAADPVSFEAGRAVVRNRCFVWRRHVPRPGSRNIARFWCCMAADALAKVRPWNFATVSHAAGMFAGMVSCVADPPAFTEPPVRREYLLATEQLAAQTGM
jgi:hypothetical protein